MMAYFVAFGSSLTMKSGSVTVVYVQKQNAKRVKTVFEKMRWIDKDFRMKIASENPEWIAIPVTDDAITETFPATATATATASSSSSSRMILNSDIRDLLIAHGSEECPLSTARLGNGNSNSSSSKDLTKVQQGLINFILEIKQNSANLKSHIQSLDNIICPKKLEYFGDDKTLIIPENAFHFCQDTTLCFIDHTNIHLLWKHLGNTHKSTRVMRRCAINPDSSIRESGMRLLWPNIQSDSPHKGTPNSPGWITVTEQGIRQSLDMTLVMFSRGNITEKIRFGNIVNEDEVLLDMYAGIGYYTLPALIKGKANYVHACEWNPIAAFALKYNLQDNGVSHRSTVYIGDCRENVVKHDLIGKCDRVSLGLLPSSEGGWKTAVSALRRDKGGWLHIHGNVPSKELQSWALWVCSCLSEHSDNLKLPSWSVVCHHIERVKSFAPTIYHYVLDVKMGPNLERRTGVIDKDSGNFLPSGTVVEKPSCALDKNGVLHQQWMM